MVNSCQVTTCLVVSFVLLIIACGLFGGSFAVVDLLESGLNVNTITQTVDTSRVYPSGRYFVGLGHTFITFPKSLQIIDFSSDPEFGADALNAGTLDGQTITVEVTLYYQLNASQLPQLYEKFGTDYANKFVNVAQSTLKNTCVKFTALQYFNAREVIAETMINDLRPAFQSLYATVELLQMRGIALSSAFEDQLTQNVIAVQNQQTAELQKQVAVTMSFTNVIQAQAQGNITEILAGANAQASLISEQASADGTTLLVNVQRDAYALLKQSLNFTNTQLIQYLWATKYLRASLPNQTLLIGFGASSTPIINIAGGTTA